jgi:hypothetical protein
MNSVESSSRSRFLFEHDPSGQARGHAFPDHALEHPPITSQRVATIKLRRHSGMARKRQTRNLEIPGSMLTHRPGMTS